MITIPMTVAVNQESIPLTVSASDVTFEAQIGAEYNKCVFHTWMGDNPKLLSTVYTADIKLSATSYGSWTASTTAGTILAAQNGTVTKLDLKNYEYILEWLWCIDLKQLEGATMKAMPDRTYGAFYQVVHQRPYGLANFETETDDYNYCTVLFASSQYNIYYNTSGSHTWSTTMYGVYATNTAGTLSSTSSLTPNLTPKSPAITARCNASYFATARKTEIDSANSTIKVVGKLYRVDRDSSPIKNMYMNAIHLYSHPL